MDVKTNTEGSDTVIRLKSAKSHDVILTTNAPMNVEIFTLYLLLIKQYFNNVYRTNARRCTFVYFLFNINTIVSLTFSIIIVYHLIIQCPVSYECMLMTSYFF